MKKKRKNKDINKATISLVGFYILCICIFISITMVLGSVLFQNIIGG